MNCLYCNKPIEGKRNTKKYCSKTCKQYAYLKRNSLLPHNLSLSQPVSDQSLVEEALLQVSPEQPEVKQNELTVISSSKESKERKYQHIWPDLLFQVQETQCNLEISHNYFGTSGYGARINAYNLSNFSFVLPRLRCILENLFFISHKRKVYYKTIKCLFLALQRVMFSDEMKKMPNDFPFLDDFVKLYDSLEAMAKFLERDKEGVKFSLKKENMVKYLVFLGLVREHVKKMPFAKLFPNIWNSGGMRPKPA